MIETTKETKQSIRLKRMIKMSNNLDNTRCNGKRFIFLDEMLFSIIDKELEILEKEIYQKLLEEIKK